MLTLLSLLVCQPALDDTTTPGAREFKLAEVPVLDYSPETNGMVGAGLLVSSVHPELSNPLQSSAGAFAFVTFNGQWGVNAFSHFYLDRDRYLLRFQAALFDGDHFFFGVGDSPTVEATTFDITDRNAELALLRRVGFRELFVGPLVRYRRVNAPGDSVSVLSGETAPDGASLLGAGGQILWDGRDRALRTTQGIYASARSLFYGAGSAFEHFEGTLDVRGSRLSATIGCWRFRRCTMFDGVRFRFSRRRSSARRIVCVALLSVGFATMRRSTGKGSCAVPNSGGTSRPLRSVEWGVSRRGPRSCSSDAVW